MARLTAFVGAAERRPWWAVALGAAVGLASWPTLLFALGQGLLFAGASLGFGSAIATVAGSLAAALFIAWRASRSWIAPAVTAAVIAGSTLLCAAIIDTSFDGQAYHFEAIDALACGWNPFHDRHGQDAGAPETIFSRHYPAGLWISSAVQVAAGLPSEAAKNQAPILLASLMLSAGAAASALGFNRVSTLLAAALAGANPILVVQLFTRMNDGLLGAALALVAIFALFGALKGQRWAWAGAAAALVLAVNLKFSAIPIAVGVCALICAAVLALRGWRPALQAGALLAAIGVAGLVVVGAHPYVTNTLHNGHPLFPLMGEGKVDIMETNRPPGFNALSPGERLARSYFGPTASGYTETQAFKVPLTVSRDELRQAGEFDSRIGGFGPFFSGALILSAILAVVISMQRGRSIVATSAVAAALGVAALSLAMPEGWWARYGPQMWWVPALLALGALTCRPRAVQALGGALALVLLANAALVTVSSANYVGKRNIDVRRQTAELAALPGPACVTLGFLKSRREILEPLGEKVVFTTTTPGWTALAGGFPHADAAFAPCRG